MTRRREGGGGYSTTVEWLFSINPEEEEDEIQRRWSGCSQHPPAHTNTRSIRWRRRIFNVGGMVVLNNNPQEEEDETQRRWSGCSQHPPCQGRRAIENNHSTEIRA
jgi:hypothetical protein